MSSNSVSKSAYRGCIFDKFIRTNFVPGLESFGSVDVPPGATRSARSSNPDENRNLVLTGEADDSLNRSESSNVGKVLLICDSDRRGSAGQPAGHFRFGGGTSSIRRVSTSRIGCLGIPVVKKC